MKMISMILQNVGTWTDLLDSTILGMRFAHRIPNVGRSETRSIPSRRFLQDQMGDNLWKWPEYGCVTENVVYPEKPNG